MPIRFSMILILIFVLDDSTFNGGSEKHKDRTGTFVIAYYHNFFTGSTMHLLLSRVYAGCEAMWPEGWQSSWVVAYIPCSKLMFWFQCKRTLRQNLLIVHCILTESAPV